MAETNRAPFDLAEANLPKRYKILKFIPYLHSLIFFKPYSAINSANCSLHPYWITGFTDAEGCFTIKYSQSNEYKMQWRVQAQFQIKLHERDLILLNQIKDFFSVGTLVKDGTKIAYTIKSIKNLMEIVIPHFDRFPLLTKKYADFKLFKEIVIIMARKGHLNKEDFAKILSLRASLNLGLSEKLKLAFPNVVAITRPEVLLREIAHPYWLTGFMHFLYIYIKKGRRLFYSKY